MLARVFITFEGLDGSGKTTQVELLKRALEADGHEVVATREPGGTELGEAVREVVLHRHEEIVPWAEAALFAAARAQLVERVIAPALARGATVLCDRYIDSSLAYQGAGYGNDMTELRTLQDFATAGLRPDLTLLLDVPVEVGLERTRRRAEWNRFEDTEEVAFFEAVREAYLRFAGDEPDRFRIVDGSASVDEADAAIRSAVEPLLP
jgi:dTMP kinase